MKLFNHDYLQRKYISILIKCIQLLIMDTNLRPKRKY